MHMKKISKLLILFMIIASIGVIQSCKEDDPQPAPTETDMTALEGNITANMTLDATKKYLIKGKVYVNAPATLTIPAGTILFGEKDSEGTLIINRGAKIDAKGTATN